MSLVSLKVQKVLTQLIISNVIEPATEEHGTTVESETVFVIPGNDSTSGPFSISTAVPKSLASCCNKYISYHI